MRYGLYAGTTRIARTVYIVAPRAPNHAHTQPITHSYIVHYCIAGSTSLSSGRQLKHLLQLVAVNVAFTSTLPTYNNIDI